MQRKTKILVFVNFLFSLFAVSYSLLAGTARAVCPICTIAVAGGLGLSRYFGIDDSVLGIWAGGLMVSITMWSVDWLNKRNYEWVKKIDQKLLNILLFIFWVLFTYVPLYETGIIGHPFNTILGIDKLIFGSIIGFFAFLIGVYLDKKQRVKFGKQFFNYQKVVFPVVSLTIFSLIIYFWGGYLYQL